jgi:hypothetical protein
VSNFENKLALSRWMLNEFGAQSFQSLKNLLDDTSLIGFDENNISFFHHALVNNSLAGFIVEDKLREYDGNIVRHWKQITERRNQGGNTQYPLYFQYISLLFTEHYLDRYFTDKTELCEDLNRFLENFNRDLAERHRIEPFAENDLNKLAVWIATGGGKTLIMHVNILQFQHYLQKYGKARSFNRTILLTPNEGLSLQHKAELDLSDISAELFVKDASSLFTSTAVEIIDIHKLKEKSGDKTVAVESFESNNLLLVDEGHRGAAGEDWMNKRGQLCEQGFSFEYSATFGQAIKAAGGSDLSPVGKGKPSKKYLLIQEYAKCILFDYSYKFFHEDGYGKDHSILNLSHVWTPEQQQLYLTGCVLAFYQQKRFYQEAHKTIADYLLSDPLWIFVGGKVTAQNEANAETVSDIQAILAFLSRFISNKAGETVNNLSLLLNKQDDLRDQRSRPVFDKTFPYVQTCWSSEQAHELFQDVLRKVFNAASGGILHVVHLKGGGGEIGLRVGANDWFGLVNVGDSAKLIKLCEDNTADNMLVTDQVYAQSLFQGINKKDSRINLLIGAKKFTEGWSSWRVSTMGLMNVGRSEGSEIIQLFGRGVRLKGYEFSLKRSNHVPGIKHPKQLPILETLNVFGIRSDYMKEFEEYLEAEGVGESETEIIELPVIKRLTRSDLKLIRPKPDLTPFKQAQRPSLIKQTKIQVTLNWYPKIQAQHSSGVAESSNDVLLNEGHLDARHLAFLDYDALYFELTRYKNEKAWYNLQIDRQTIAELLTDSSWYRLYIPADMLEIGDFARVRVWQEIAVALLKKYSERYYIYKKNEYEAPHLEYYEIKETDPNFINEYKASVAQSEDVWIKKLTELAGQLNEKKFVDFKFGNLKVFDFSRHLYQPLIHFQNNEIVKIAPVPLNKGEYAFVDDLKAYHAKEAAFFSDKELFLLRNQSKNGLGFFDAGNFYPDFILWLIDGKKQFVNFIDPKGLLHIQGFNDPKIRFHKTIKDIEIRLGDPMISLNAFTVSNTHFEKISWWRTGTEIEKDFKNNHVLFQNDDKDGYIASLFEAVLA